MDNNIQSIPSIVANLRHAARNRETCVIGGGEFGPSELLEAANLIAECCTLRGKVETLATSQSDMATQHAKELQDWTNLVSAMSDVLEKSLPLLKGHQETHECATRYKEALAALAFAKVRDPNFKYQPHPVLGRATDSHESLPS